MNEKLPYYMAYPMPFSYDDERTERMDYEYLKSMYPDIPKRILPYVEEECDRMEYENSMIYDEYPDKLQLKLMCRRVFDRIKKFEKSLQIPDLCCGREEDAYEDGKTLDGISSDQTLRSLTEVMIYQELYKRRCDHRRRCRRFY